MECYCYLRNVQDLLEDGKAPYERRFGEPFTGPIIPFGAKVGYHPISTRDQSRLHQLDKNVLPGFFLGYTLIAVNLGRKHCDCGYRDVEKMDASEICPRRTHAKEVSTSQREKNSDSQLQMVQQNCQEETANSENPTLRRQRNVRSEDLSGELQGEPGEPQPTESKKMTLKPVPTSCRFKVTSSIVITINLEFNSVPKEETFLVPLKYIDVAKSTHTDLEVVQEKRSDDYWNVDSNRSLSDSRTRLTTFTLLKENPPKGYVWSGERLTKVQMTTSPDHVWPEVRSKSGKPLRIEKNKKKNLLYFPDDEENKET